MYHVYSATQKGGSTEPPAYGPDSCNCSYYLCSVALVIWEGGGAKGIFENVAEQ